MNMPEPEQEKPNFYTLYQKVGNIDGKLDVALKSLEKYNNRLDEVEKVQDQLVGKISIFGALAGIVGGIITTIFASLFLRK